MQLFQEKESVAVVDRGDERQNKWKEKKSNIFFIKKRRI